MERLFEVETTVERCCGTCAHSTGRHGRHTKGTYPLVCLLMACAVPYRYGDGTRATDYPCRIDFDAGGPHPRGWEERGD